MPELVIRLAKESTGWGYRRIVGELRKLRLTLGRSSVRRILKDEGPIPSPLRRGKAGKTTWQKFICLDVNTLVACDFFTKNVITPFGIGQEYVRFFNEHRPHQGRGNLTIPAAATGPPEEHVFESSPEFGHVRCQRFLGGLLRHHCRAAV